MNEAVILFMKRLEFTVNLCLVQPGDRGWDFWHLIGEICAQNGKSCDQAES